MRPRFSLTPLPFPSWSNAHCIRPGLFWNWSPNNLVHVYDISCLFVELCVSCGNVIADIFRMPFKTMYIQWDVYLDDIGYVFA